MAHETPDELDSTLYSLRITPQYCLPKLNEDIVKLIWDEFNPGKIVRRFAEQTSGRETIDIQIIGSRIFEEYGETWMRRTMEMATAQCEDISVDILAGPGSNRGGARFLFFPDVPQRFIEIAYLSTQCFPRLPLVLNSGRELTYRVQRCLLFNEIEERCGSRIARLMTCQSACLNALETMRSSLELNMLVSVGATTPRQGYCEFTLRKS